MVVHVGVHDENIHDLQEGTVELDAAIDFRVEFIPILIGADIFSGHEVGIGRLLRGNVVPENVHAVHARNGMLHLGQELVLGYDRNPFHVAVVDFRRRRRRG